VCQKADRDALDITLTCFAWLGQRHSDDSEELPGFNSLDDDGVGLVCRVAKGW